MINREEFRKIKSMNKDELDKWISRREAIIYTTLRKEFEKDYNNQLSGAVDVFTTAIAYSLHFGGDTKFGQKRMTSFLEDLFVTIDMFRTGEYNPNDYKEALEKAGIKINCYDYSKLYKDVEDKYKEQIEKKDEYIKELEAKIK